MIKNRNNDRSSRNTEKNLNSTLKQIMENASSRNKRINENIDESLIEKFKKIFPVDEVNVTDDVFALYLNEESSAETIFVQNGIKMFVFAFSYHSNYGCVLTFRRLDRDEEIRDIYNIEEDKWTTGDFGRVLNGITGLDNKLQQLLCKIAMIVNPETRYNKVTIFESLSNQKPSDPRMRLNESSDELVDCDFEEMNPEVLRIKRLVYSSWIHGADRDIKSPLWRNLSAEKLAKLEDGEYGDPVEAEKWYLIYATKYADKPCPQSFKQARINGVMLNLVNAYERDSDGDWEQLADDFQAVRVKKIQGDDPITYTQEVDREEDILESRNSVNEDLITEFAATLSTGATIMPKKLQTNVGDLLVNKKLCNNNVNDPRWDIIKQSRINGIDKDDDEHTGTEYLLMSVIYALKLSGITDCPTTYEEAESYKVWSNVIAMLEERGVPMSEFEDMWNRLGTLATPKPRGSRKKKDDDSDDNAAAQTPSSNVPPKPQRQAPKKYKGSKFDIDKKTGKITYDNIPVIDISDWDDIYKAVEPSEDDRIRAQQLIDIENHKYNEIPHVVATDEDEEEIEDGEITVASVNVVEPQDVPTEIYDELDIDSPDVEPATQSEPNPDDDDFDSEDGGNEPEGDNAGEEGSEDAADEFNEYDNIQGEEPIDDEEVVIDAEGIEDEPESAEDEPVVASENDVEIVDDESNNEEEININYDDLGLEDGGADNNEANVDSDNLEDNTADEEDIDFDNLGLETDGSEEIEVSQEETPAEDGEIDDNFDDEEININFDDLGLEDDDDEGKPNINNIDISGVESSDKIYIEEPDAVEPEVDDFDVKKDELDLEFDEEAPEEEAPVEIKADMSDADDLLKASVKSGNLDEYNDKNLDKAYADKYPTMIQAKNGKIGVQFQITDYNLPKRQNTKLVTVWRDTLADIFNLALILDVENDDDVEFMGVSIRIPRTSRVLNQACFQDYLDALRDTDEQKYKNVYHMLQDKRDKLKKLVNKGELFNFNVTEPDGSERPITFEDVEKWLADNGEQKL